MSSTPSSDASARAIARDDVRAVFAHIAETCDLPPMPAAAARALKLARDPDTTTEALAKVVLTDPALAARVLTMSRSVLYLRRTPPRTLQEAIVTVGFQGLRRILMAASARSAYSADDVVAQRLWAHSLATALAADELAKAEGTDTAGGGDAFIAGLLHDVGKLIFHLADPKAFANLGVFDAERERELFGATHDIAGACVADMWGLDEVVVKAILGHHGGDEPSPLAALIARADRIATEIGYASFTTEAPSATDPEVPELCDRVRTLFESERSLFE
jgi:putative nucleotidyltransferase with HDIG domain